MDNQINRTALIALPSPLNPGKARLVKDFLAGEGGKALFEILAHQGAECAMKAANVVSGSAHPARMDEVQELMEESLFYTRAIEFLKHLADPDFNPQVFEFKPGPAYTSEITSLE